MHFSVNEFLEEQSKGLAEFLENARKSQVAAARKAARASAVRIRSLNARVGVMAKSGVRLTSVSQGKAERLIELQAEIVTSALDEAAKRLKCIADTESPRDLVRGQGEVLQAARRRIVQDMERALTILRSNGGDARKVTGRSKPKRAASRAKPVSRAGARRKPARKVRVKSARG